MAAHICWLFANCDHSPAVLTPEELTQIHTKHSTGFVREYRKILLVHHLFSSHCSKSSRKTAPSSFSFSMAGQALLVMGRCVGCLRSDRTLWSNTVMLGSPRNGKMALPLAAFNRPTETSGRFFNDLDKLWVNLVWKKHIFLHLQMLLTITTHLPKDGCSFRTAEQDQNPPELDSGDLHETSGYFTEFFV